MPHSIDGQAPPELAAGLAAFMARAGAKGRALLAVSGGSDSIALMRLAASLGAAAFEVATVDHGLRAGSREEALMVGEAARRLGLRHEILTWEGEKPASGLQAAARAARYRLLVSHALTIGADAIIVAHTADDQAETIMMRKARGAGPRGLGGMAETSLIAAGASTPVRLLRPFLSVRRATLRRYLDAQGAGFIDDPSNEDMKFERVRARRLLREAEGDETPMVEELLRTADAMRREAVLIEAAENARFARLGGRFSCFGTAILEDTPAVGDCGLIARLIFAAGGGEHPPSADAAAMALGKSLAGLSATLGGALLERAGSAVRVRREPAALFGRSGVAPMAPLPLAPGEQALWDSRFIVRNILGAPADIRPIDAEAAERFGLVAEAAGAPCLTLNGEICAIPGESDAFTSLAQERFYRQVNRFQ